MTRRITETFHGYEQPDVVVTLPDDHEHPGEHKGNLRAWAVDDETGDWWGMCQYYVATGVQLLGWIHESQLRRDGRAHRRRWTIGVERCGTPAVRELT